MTTQPDWIVLKFGGTSVASRERWETIRTQAARVLEEGARPLVVCSAVSGVTNLLEALPDAARNGEHDELLESIVSKHRALASELGVPIGAVCEGLLEELGRMARGIALVDEVSPRTRARILASGELLSTALGVAFLNATGLETEWVDARENLVAWRRENAPTAAAREAAADTTRRRDERWYLSAQVHDDADPALAERLRAIAAPVLVTQGFVAGAASVDGGQRETVVLGRGGSDTSAAIFAARLGAARCEIWTDVPGMFTADPRSIPGARLLQHLDYTEAQEIASTGAKVLHPRSIPPVRKHRIPMHIRCAPNPELPATIIEEKPADGAPQVKALSTKSGITVVSMDAVDMWQQVGFLADVFVVFKQHSLSVDLVSTSESNVTVTLDRASNSLDAETLERLAEDLARHCRVRISTGLSAISLVGIGIRSILHRLGSALELFEEHPVRLVTQAASDLNLTFVVESDREERVLRRLHTELFEGAGQGGTFGPAWRVLFPETRGAASLSLESATLPGRWWLSERERLLSLATEGTPTYVYHGPTIRERARRLKGLQAVDRVYYAIKANSHEEVLATVRDEGLGLECVSPGELERASTYVPTGERAERLLFTPNFAPRGDYQTAYDLGAVVTVDNLHPLAEWPELFADKELMVRVDVGSGRGHHEKVKTAGAKSKFGVDPAELGTLRDLAERCGARVVGLHAHSGSGIETPEAWQDVATGLARYAEHFRGLRYFDVGGGLGVPYKSGQAALDLSLVDEALLEVRRAYDLPELWIEPGRYLVAEAGVLLATVTQIKHKRDVTWVGVDAGMHSLIRPTLYGSWHPIVNLSKLGQRPSAEPVHVVGPICESGDFLGQSRHLPPTEEGDVLLIDVAGAYGMSMASHYNLRGVPREVVLSE